MWAAVVSAVGACDALVGVVEPTPKSPDTTRERVLITFSKWTILTSAVLQEITHDISIV